MHLAELVTFSEVRDLPNSLHPFVEIKGVYDNQKVEKDTKVIVLKIKGTLDCHHVIFVNGDTTIQKVEDKLFEDLKCVRLENETRKKIKEILSDLNTEKVAFEEKDGTVLIVEDNNNAREILSAILAREGYDVETARDLSEALEKIQTLEISAVIMSLDLADALPGAESIRVIRRIVGNQIPVITITSKDSPKLERKVRGAGVFCHLVKPCAMSAVTSRVSGAIADSHYLRRQRTSNQHYPTLSSRQGFIGNS